VAASNDLLAHWLYASVATISWTFRIIVPLVPPLVGFVTYRLMKALQASGRERLATLPMREVLRPAEIPAGAGALAALGDGQGSAAAELRLFQEADGRWRWRYADPERDVDLCSNKSFVTADDAREAAARAYPETPFSQAAGADATLVE
jgi:hypothetical protein